MDVDTLCHHTRRAVSPSCIRLARYRQPMFAVIRLIEIDTRTSILDEKFCLIVFEYLLVQRHHFDEAFRCYIDGVVWTEARPVVGSRMQVLIFVMLFQKKIIPRNHEVATGDRCDMCFAIKYRKECQQTCWRECLREWS